MICRLACMVSLLQLLNITALSFLRLQNPLKASPGTQLMFVYKLQTFPKHPSSSLLSKDISAVCLLLFLSEGSGVGAHGSRSVKSQSIALGH